MRRRRKTNTWHIQRWPEPMPAAQQIELCRELVGHRRRMAYCRRMQRLAVDHSRLLAWSYYGRQWVAAHHEYERVRNILWERNMRLVVHEAGRLRTKHVSGDDLVGVGALRLRYAIDRFDPDRGTCLSTYLVVALRRDMAHHVEREHTLQAKMVHIDRSDETSALEEMMPAPSIKDYDQPTELDWLVDAVKPAIQALPERDQHVLSARLSGADLRDVGVAHGVSRERARQWEKKALTGLAQQLGAGAPLSSIERVNNGQATAYRNLRPGARNSGCTGDQVPEGRTA